MSRRQKVLVERRKIEPKPANCQDRQQSQDVNIIFQRLLAAGSNATATLDLTVFLKEDYVCLKPLVLKLFSAPTVWFCGQHTARLSKAMLSKLVFLKCNTHMNAAVAFYSLLSLY